MVHYLYMYGKGFNGYFVTSGLVKSMFYITKQGGCLNDMHLTKKMSVRRNPIDTGEVW